MSSTAWPRSSRRGTVVRAVSGDEYGYDALIVATGARAVDALPGALTFPGPGAAAALSRAAGGA